VAWLGNSSTATRLIDCLLNAWDSPVFSGVNYSIQREINHPYWRRSQPRVNHLLEVAVTGGAVAAPRVCTFPRNLVRNALAHLSGYPSVFHKLACARVDGLTYALAYRPGGPSRRLLSYAVPRDASPHEQRDALGRAFDLAARSNRTLVLPQAFFHGEQYNFCRLYDISHILGTDPMDTRFMSRQEASAQEGGACESEPLLRRRRPTIEESSAALRFLSHFKSPLVPLLSDERVLCAPFLALVHPMRIGGSLQPAWAGATPRMCNPNTKQVSASKACYSEKGAWRPGGWHLSSSSKGKSSSKRKTKSRQASAVRLFKGHGAEAHHGAVAHRTASPAR
jgi:hypothetical protein